MKEKMGGLPANHKSLLHSHSQQGAYTRHFPVVLTTFVLLLLTYTYIAFDTSVSGDVAGTARGGGNESSSKTLPEILDALQFSAEAGRAPLLRKFLEGGSRKGTGKGGDLTPSARGEQAPHATTPGEDIANLQRRVVELVANWTAEPEQPKNESAASEGAEETQGSSLLTTSPPLGPPAPSGTLSPQAPPPLGSPASVTEVAADKGKTDSERKDTPAANGQQESKAGGEGSKAEGKGDKSQGGATSAAGTSDSATSASATSEAPPLGHPGDLAEVARLKPLMASVAKDNTVVITPANSAFLDLVFNLRCRLNALGATNVLYWALDKVAADRFEAEGIPHYYDPNLFSVSGSTGYHDADYIRMMSERPRVWWRLLATGYDFLFLDADVVAFDHPDTYFEKTADLAGQINGWGWKFEKERTNNSHLCAGAFWVKSSDLSLEFMRKAFDSFEERKGKEARWDDQKALNWIIHDPNFSDVITANVPEGQKVRTGGQVATGRFRVMFAEAEKILPGHLFWGAKIEGDRYNVTFTTKMQANDTDTFSFRPSLFHMSGHGKKKDKVARMKSYGWWELDENEKCKDGRGR